MRIFFNMLLILGVVFLIGTAGASDLDIITIPETLKQVFTSIIFLCFGIIGRKVFKKKKLKIRKNKVQKQYYHAA